MPQLISKDFDMILKNSKQNKADTEAFLLQQPINYLLPDFVVPAGYQLRVDIEKETTDGIKREICFITEGEEPETIYKVQTIYRHESNAYMRSKNCTQLLIWRTSNAKHAYVLQDFPKKIFNHLLSQYDIMITDDQQTEDGKRFWESRMSEAIYIENRCLYYIDLQKRDNEMVPYLEEITTQDELTDKYIPQGWGEGEEFRNRIFVISTRNIN